MKIFGQATALVAVLTLVACGSGHDHAPDAAQEAEAPRPAETEWTELLPNARQPLADVVSGGQPSEAQLAEAAAAGYRTVINLRMPSEDGLPDEAARVAELGMEYVSLPIDGAEAITEDNARALSRSLETAERPVLLHCGSGNRVGALLALSAYYVDGRSADEALQYGLDSGLTRLEPLVRERLSTAGDD
jgi:uncharacterized protein (TIGR01244 family)